MNTCLKITVLVENTAGNCGVLAEHGLSFLIEIAGEKILFDTGQGFVLKHNLKRMRLSLNDVTSVVLSHGHYDHTGGLSTALSMMDHPTVYAHPAVVEPKYSRETNGTGRFNGMPEQSKDALLKTEWIRITEPLTLPGGLRLTGPIPRIADFEDTGGPFYLDAACTDPDPIEDDLAAFIETEQGTIVILGCAHAGVINTLRYIRQLTDQQPIHTVIGGMHLHSASEKRIQRTVTALRELNIRRIFPCHCTGFDAAARLTTECPGKISVCPVGTELQCKKGEKMKIAIPTANGKLCMHFGHCQQFEILTVDPDEKTISGCEAMTPPPHEPGVLPAWLHEQGVNLIIAGGMGQRAQQLFAQNDIQVVVGAPATSSEDLVTAWMNGTLVSGTNVCDH